MHDVPLLKTGHRGMEDLLKALAVQEIDKTVALFEACRSSVELMDTVRRIAERCTEAVRRGNKVMFAGNGGSAADAQHLAAELVGKLCYDRPGLASMSLTSDTSVLTAIGNDYGYEHVFSRQVEAVGIEGDVFVGISTSGRSRNVIRAMEAARTKGIFTVSMTGAAGGDMLTLSDLCLRIPSNEVQKVQEAHIVFGHVFCTLIERAMFPLPRES